MEEALRYTAMAVLRFSGFTANALLFGLPLFCMFVLRPSLDGASPGEVDARRAGRRMEDLVRAALIASALAVVVTLLLQSALTATVRGRDLNADAMSSVLSSDFGAWSAARLPLLLGLSVILLGRVRSTLAGRMSALWWGSWVALAFGLLITTSLAGHAAVASPPLSVVNDVLHLASGGAWFAGVIGLTVLVPATARSEVALPVVAGAVSRFAPIALGAIALAAVTGTTNSFLGLERFGDLVGSGYGRVLFVKILIFLVIVGLGSVSHFIVRRRLNRVASEIAGGEAAQSLFRRVIASEVAVGAVLVVVTALLTGLDPPGF